MPEYMMFYKSILKTNPILSCFWRCGKLQFFLLFLRIENVFIKLILWRYKVTTFFAIMQEKRSLFFVYYE